MDIEKMSTPALVWHIQRQQTWRKHYEIVKDYSHVETCKNLLRSLLAEYAKRGIGK